MPGDVEAKARQLEITSALPNMKKRADFTFRGWVRCYFWLWVRFEEQEGIPRGLIKRAHGAPAPLRATFFVCIRERGTDLKQLKTFRIHV